MLSLTYRPTAAGAPSEYGAATDYLQAANAAPLQDFPKAQPGFMPPSDRLVEAIGNWLPTRARPADPLVVMVHGYLYDPAKTGVAGGDSPFATVYGLPPAANSQLSWLPLVGECDADGANPTENAIAFAYTSESPAGEFARAGWDNEYQYAVFDQSPLAARALASILAALGARHDITVRILAHSLGTRTTSQAIGLLRARMPANLDRVVLLDGAEFCVDAAANFAGCSFDVINIVNGTDLVLRLGAEKMCHPVRPNGAAEACVIGYDGLGGNARWIDLRLDNPELVTWCAAARAPDGVPYALQAMALDGDPHPLAGLDHWSCYTNPGNRPFVRDLLFSDVMTVAQLRAHGASDGSGQPMYGQFAGRAIPLVPPSRVARQRLIAQAALTTTSAGGGG